MDVTDKKCMRSNEPVKEIRENKASDVQLMRSIAQKDNDFAHRFQRKAGSDELVGETKRVGNICLHLFPTFENSMVRWVLHLQSFPQLFYAENL